MSVFALVLGLMSGTSAPGPDGYVIEVTFWKGDPDEAAVELSPRSADEEPIIVRDGQVGLALARIPVSRSPVTTRTPPPGSDFVLDPPVNVRENLVVRHAARVFVTPRHTPIGIVLEVDTGAGGQGRVILLAAPGKPVRYGSAGAWAELTVRAAD